MSPRPARHPRRGEIWLVNFNPTLGHEQAGMRPALVLSANRFNAGPSGLVVVLPITKRNRGILTHIPVAPPEGGLNLSSVILCDQLRTVSAQRLSSCFGEVSPSTLGRVEVAVRILLEF